MIRIPGHKGKRIVKEKMNKKKLFMLIILISILVITAICIVLKVKKDDNDIQTNANVVNSEIDEPNKEENTIKEDEIVDVSDLPEKIGSYTVIGELVIDKIDLKKSILDRTEDSALALSITKFYGPDINEVGNFCITGHNYNNLFKRLKELEINDTFYLINKETKTKVEYQIYDIYSCNPNQVECLNQPTEDVREVTLITCNPGGLTRLICKAKEI